jgi:hypothetical protein
MVPEVLAINGSTAGLAANQVDPIAPHNGHRQVVVDRQSV